MTKVHFKENCNTLMLDIHKPDRPENLLSFVKENVVEQPDQISDSQYETANEYYGHLCSLVQKVEKDEISNTLFLVHANECLEMIYLTLK